MRTVLICLLALSLAACRTRIRGERESPVYGGVGLATVPDVGGFVTGGQFFSRTHPRFDFAFEMRAALQGGDDSATQNGRAFQAFAGVRQIASPGHRGRPYAIYGATWIRVTGDPRVFDTPGDYLGILAGFGYEYSLTPRWTISPEVSFAYLGGEGSLGTQLLPQFTLGLLFNF